MTMVMNMAKSLPKVKSPFPPMPARPSEVELRNEDDLTTLIKQVRTERVEQG
ncbi:hypothetical protein [Bifidobacterium sp. UTBIF-78]|uniref:hypothetical protein n=1 Tax=Bifidobacterium sp. UTBIF-78 TaxID=1465263 RepID=UPI0015E2E963|nr:hypothetical protein [Bifidobacterium sp. UTBIF-78]